MKVNLLITWRVEESTEIITSGMPRWTVYVKGNYMFDIDLIREF